MRSRRMVGTAMMLTAHQDLDHPECGQLHMDDLLRAGVLLGRPDGRPLPAEPVDKCAPRSDRGPVCEPGSAQHRWPLHRLLEAQQRLRSRIWARFECGQGLVGGDQRGRRPAPATHQCPRL